MPDIDFNIRTGNALVGYANFDEVDKDINNQIDFDNVMEKISDKAKDMQTTFDEFRSHQIKANGLLLSEIKKDLRQRSLALEKELNGHLASEYGVQANDRYAYNRWIKSHKPFHWFTEFYGVIRNGGFDIVIGNPPYISTTIIRETYTVRGYETERCSDIYAWIMERSQSLVSQSGRIGMITPLSITFSRHLQSLRTLLLKKFRLNWFSSFSKRPAALFSSNVQVRNTIYLGCRRGNNRAYTTSTYRWYSKARQTLFEKIQYAEFNPSLWDGLIPKLSHQQLLCSLELAKKSYSSLDKFHATEHSQACLYYTKTAYNWVSFSLKPAPCFDLDWKPIPPTGTGKVCFVDSLIRDLAHVFLNGKIGILWWSIVGSDFTVTLSNFKKIPFPAERVGFFIEEKGESLRVTLEDEMKSNRICNVNAGKRIGNYNLAKCRNVSDQSDLIWKDALGLQDVWDEVELAYVQLVKTDFS